jgi:hypothetical protein
MCEVDNVSTILITSIYMAVEAATLAGCSYSSIIRYSSVSIACEMMVHDSRYVQSVSGVFIGL